MAERWRDVQRYKGLYQVSNRGRVKSLPRLVASRWSCGQLLSEKILKPQQFKKSESYLYVDLCKDGIKQRYALHQLVLETFGTQCPPGMECRHLDGDPTNNHVRNLCWGTKKKNQSDRVIHGTDMRGEKHPNTKLTAIQVKEIRKRREQGESAKSIHKDFPQIKDRHSIYQLAYKRTWKYS